MIVLVNRPPAPRLRPTIDEIIGAVAEYMNIDRASIIGYSRERETSYARHLAQYLAHTDGRARIADIQRAFSGRDHSTIIGGIQRIELELRTRPETGQDVAECRAALEGKEARVWSTSRP